MQLPFRSFSQLVQDMAATVQGASGQLSNLSVGSVLRAILEANASVGLWMQCLFCAFFRRAAPQPARGATWTAGWPILDSYGSRPLRLVALYDSRGKRLLPRPSSWLVRP